ncbi:MAG: hypothetical protein ACPGPE_15680, partial [Planctomycetota bacterium]
MKGTLTSASSVLAALLVAGFMPSVAEAQDDGEGASTAPAEPRVVLEDLSGERTFRGADAGPLQSLAAAGAAFARFE